MNISTKEHNFLCHGVDLTVRLNDLTNPYAYKYPKYKNPEDENESPYDLLTSSTVKLTNAQKNALIQLYDAYFITPQYLTGENIAEEDKLKLICAYQDEYRTLFRREEERIICTEAFRRLQYKTQVMVNSASDDQRTRLLHSLEVQKNARKIAIALNANYELAETIAIAHDIGHAPFGHAGEKAINDYLEEHWAGAFSHALQSVKVIDFLCSHRALKPKGLKGLGVSDLVLEGVLKHDSDSFTDNLASARYRLQYDCPTLYKPVGVDDASIYPDDEISIGGIEAQIVCWADKIAYMGHDWEEFVAVDLLEVMLSRINSMVIDLDEFRKINATADNSCKKYNYVSCPEKEKLDNIALKLTILKEKFASEDYQYNTYSQEDAFVKALDNLVDACDEALSAQKTEPSEFLLFSREQYSAFCAFFKITRSWIVITHRKPQKHNGRVDLIYAIYEYLSGTTSHRTVPALVDGLVRCSLAELSDNQLITYDRCQMIQHCNQKWNVAKVEQNSSRSIKSRLRKCFAVHFDDTLTDATEYVNSFIHQEFIKSTRVCYMTQKAEIIIKRLMDYYFANYKMLPLKHRNRVEFEMSQRTKREFVKTCLRDYYYEKANESSEICGLYEFIRARGKDLSIRENISRGNGTLPETINEIINDESIIKDVIKLRVIADYVSGMTDRMAEMKYNEICSSGTQWSKAYSERGTFNL